MRSGSDPGLYAVLGVPTDASDTTVRAAYLREARRHHPDRQAGGSDAARARAEQRMRELNQAWAVLGDPARRAAYDAERARQVPGAPPRWRPDGGPNPDFVPLDDDEHDDAAFDAWLDEVDVFPDGPGRGVPRWLQLLPAVLAVAAFVALVVGFTVSLPELLGFGVALGALALVAFVLVPIVAVGAAARRGR